MFHYVQSTQLHSDGLSDCSGCTYTVEAESKTQTRQSAHKANTRETDLKTYESGSEADTDRSTPKKSREDTKVRKVVIVDNPAHSRGKGGLRWKQGGGDNNMSVGVSVGGDYVKGGGVRVPVGGERGGDNGWNVKRDGGGGGDGTLTTELLQLRRALSHQVLRLRELCTSGRMMREGMSKEEKEEEEERQRKRAARHVTVMARKLYDLHRQVCVGWKESF